MKDERTGTVNIWNVKWINFVRFWEEVLLTFYGVDRHTVTQYHRLSGLHHNEIRDERGEHRGGERREESTEEVIFDVRLLQNMKWNEMNADEFFLQQ